MHSIFLSEIGLEFFALSASNFPSWAILEAVRSIVNGCLSSVFPTHCFQVTVPCSLTLEMCFYKKMSGNGKREYERLYKGFAGILSVTIHRPFKVGGINSHNRGTIFIPTVFFSYFRKLSLKLERKQTNLHSFFTAVNILNAQLYTQCTWQLKGTKGSNPGRKNTKGPVTMYSKRWNRSCLAGFWKLVMNESNRIPWGLSC